MPLCFCVLCGKCLSDAPRPPRPPQYLLKSSCVLWVLLDKVGVSGPTTCFSTAAFRGRIAATIHSTTAVKFHTATATFVAT